MNRKIFAIAILIAAIAGSGSAYVTSKLLSEDSSKVSQTSPSPKRDGDKNYLSASYPSPQSPQAVDLTFAAHKSVAAVVNIEKVETVEYGYRQGGGMEEFFQFFGMPRQNSPQQQPRSQERRSGGSGVIISEDGYIISNNHVVEKASKLKVTLNDGTSYDARIIGTDPTTDIALIKVEAEGLPTVEFGNSDDLKLGEWVLAVGNPFNLSSTVTAGIVSAKGRSLNAINSQFPLESFIQTDAAINPGNSGGALVNTNGELVGINTLIYSQTGNYVGYGFAVPTTIVKKVIIDLKEYGVVQRAMLGISYQEITDDFIEQYGKERGITEKGGLYIAEVTDNGAAKSAGVVAGDILVEIDGNAITNPSVLQETIAKHRPNDKIDIAVKRDGKVKHFEVVLRNRAGEEKLLDKGSVDIVSFLGGEFAAASQKLLKQLDIKHGIQVVKVGDGMLRKANVKEGFVMTHINNIPLTGVNDIYKVSGKVSTIDGIYPNGQRICYSIVNAD